MPRLFLSSLFLTLAVCSLDAKPAASQTDKIPIHGLPFDPAKLATSIRESYYHPDELTGIDCTASIDWAEMFKTMKIEAPGDRLKVLQGMTMKVHAVRDKPTELQFAWGGDEPSNRANLEAGAQQMIGGFYQMYWSFSSPGMVPKPREIKQIEPQPTGETIVSYSDHGVDGSVTLDKDSVPEHLTFNSAAMKGSLDTSFSASPNPVPGDMRRLRSVHVVYQFGTSNVNADISMEYQAVGGINIPSRVLMTIPGAYSVPINFTACSVSREITIAP